MSARKSIRSAGNNASALLHVGETALVVRTDGLNLELDGPQPFTAWWKISAARRFDRVIVYLARPGHNEAEVYCAETGGQEQRATDDRWKIFLSNVQAAGTTQAAWHEFVDAAPGARNPVRYVTK